MVNFEQVRAFWLERQGLLSPAGAGIPGIVRQAGWLNTAGGAGPYIAIRARFPGCGRSDVDRAVFQDGDLVEVPATRGCTMLVCREDAALALRCARRFDAERFEKLRMTCGVTEREVKQLSDAVAAILEAGAATLDELRERLSQHLVRSLGEEGKRLGDSSTLTVALRHLQLQGTVQRYAANRRLDSSRYAYRAFRPGTIEKGALPAGEEQVRQELARRFFHWAGPATLKEFAWWVGSSQRAAKEAVEGIDLVRVSVAGWAEDALLDAKDSDRLRESLESDRATICLLPFRDNYLYFRRNMGIFLRPEDRGIEVLDWRNRLAPIAGLDSIHNHTIVAAGRLVGLWDYDHEHRQVVWAAFGKLTNAQRQKLILEIGGLEQFIQQELGDVQFYAMDINRKRRERIRAISRLTTDN